MSEPVRWVIPAVMVVAALGVFLQLWWERRRPSSYPGSVEHEAALASVEDGTAPNLSVWRGLSTDQQAAYDQAVLDAAEAAAARLAVECASKTNALYRP
jgi:hypothetical protein